jgi:hypothetical protein
MSSSRINIRGFTRNQELTHFNELGENGSVKERSQKGSLNHVSNRWNM